MKQSERSKRLWSHIARVDKCIAVIVEAYVTMVLDAIEDSAKVLKLCNRVRTHVRNLLRQRGSFMEKAYRQDLRDSPALRKRVRYDLGGKLAMVKWERRRRRAKVHEQFLAARKAQGLGSFYQPDFDRPKKRYARKTPRKAWKPKTDRHNIFRLAVIKTRPLERRKKAKPNPEDIKPKSRVVSERLLRFQPVQVTPHELGERPFSGLDAPYPPPPATGGSPPMGTAPPIDRPPIS